MMDPMAIPPPGYHPSPQPSAMSPDPVIDPSLAIDPAILGQACDPQQSASPQHSSGRASPASATQIRMEQGPQGDPFAPQQNSTFFQPGLPSLPRPLKRKRKTRPAARRDDECSFCQGDDSRNKSGELEDMVSCVACGRSGHPSCLGIQGIADVLRSYPWHCIECKICEVCEKKGNGNRMLFCDACDRGWHMDCLDPPLDSTPDGSWICPLCRCAPLPLQEDIDPPIFPTHSVAASPAPSVASSSRSPIEQKSRMRATTRVKHKAKDDSEIDDLPRLRHKVESETRTIHRPRGRPKGKGKASSDVKGKGKARASQNLEATFPTLKLPRKMRLLKRSRSHSTDPRPSTTRKVRLVVRKPRTVPDEDEEDAENNGSLSHMFEGVLTLEESSTSSTRVLDADKTLFNRSRARAEQKIGPPVAPPPFPSALLTPGPGTPTTPGQSASLSVTSGLVHALRTRHSLVQASISADAPPGTPNANGQANVVSLPPRIRTIRFGEYDVDAWYDAPFPEEYASVPDGKLWMCEFCLKYMRSRFQSTRHRMKCKARHPPGDEIYRDGMISVFEVDGRKNKIYCQNLCLLSKMFLDHKSLFYDVEPFLFYVMTEVDRLGARFVGYFSKEKRSPKNYNVSCIMTLPVRQRKGWGNILIDFSYLLSKKEERVGSPERPLSALGALAYKQYWTHTIKLFLHTAHESIRLEDISRATSMTLEDIYNTLRDLDYITAKEPTPPPPPRPPPGTPIKYLRGRKNGPGITRRGLARTSVKDDSKAPLVIPTEYTLHWNREELDAYVAAWHAKEHVKIQPRCLKWSPFLLSRTRNTETVDGEGDGAEPRTVRDPAGAAVADQDRSSVGSTKATQTGLNGVTVSTPRLPGELSSSEATRVVETHLPVSIDVEVSKSLDPEPASRDASQMAEDRAFAAKLAQMSDSPRRLSTRSRSYREASIEEPRSTPSTSEHVPPRTLRSGGSVNKRLETMAKPETSQDSALAAILAREGTRQTRSMSHRIDPQKTNIARSFPRKRRRVESSPSPESDADSLSDLTDESSSPSPQPRRVKGAINGRLKSQAQKDTNGAIPKSSLQTRSGHTDASPLTSRLTLRTNGVTSSPLSAQSAADGKPLNEIQTRTRSMHRAKGDVVYDHGADVNSEQTVSESYQKDEGGEREKRNEEVKKGVADDCQTSLNKFAERVPGEGLDGVTPVMYDEDALGEEDAEGEEDPNPSDIDR